MIKFATVLGGPLCSKEVGALVGRLRTAFDHHNTERFSGAVEMLFITLFISGEVENYELEGCGKLRFQRKNNRLVIDIGILEASWKGCISSEIADIVSKYVKISFSMAQDWCLKHADPIPPRVASGLNASLAEFAEGIEK